LLLHCCNLLLHSTLLRFLSSAALVWFVSARVDNDDR
jgi:hypothetical protein